ncbi:MAG: hypothetical protein J6D18_04805 [Erysipelotrichaceae bacterium]|nr:hypothetical protein [Erysipelotrichaceae bacterium]
MNIKAYVVVDTTDDYIIHEIQKQMNGFGVTFSFSPARVQESLDHCMEFHATASCASDQYCALLKQLNQSWDGEQEEYRDYGYNTRMFHSHVYYLEVQIV